MKISEQPNTTPTHAAETTYQPLVSVIMPAYNTASFIREAIDSVLSQDYSNKELIIIDDGSTDGTVEIIQEYGDSVTLLTQHNQGSAVARNTGLDTARGEYVAFLDSDDVWLSGKLSTQVAYMQNNPEIGMIYTRWHVWKPGSDGNFTDPELFAEPFDSSSRADTIVEEGSGWLYNRLLFTSLLHTITVMARYDLIEKTGRFDPDLKRGQDYDYWLRASRNTQIHQLDQVLALYRLHGNGCVKKWPYVNYEKQVVENALNRWGLSGPTGEVTDKRAIQRRLSDTCFSFGYHHYWEGSSRLALKAFAESLGHYPGRLAAWRYLLMSFLRPVFNPAARR